MKLRDIISQEGSQMSGSMAARKKKLDMMSPDEIKAYFQNRADVAKAARGGVVAPGFSAKELAQRQEFSFGREFAKMRPYSRHFESTQKPYVSQASDGKWNVLDKNGKTVFSSGNYTVAQDYFKKNYDNLKETELDEGLKDWLQKMAVAGIIVGSVAGIGSINNAINNNVPVIQAMNRALDAATQRGDQQLIQNIKQDIETAKISLDSGQNLNTEKNMQDRYAKFMPADYKPSTPPLKFKEGYGRYWCSTDKKWKMRKAPKQTRKTESELNQEMQRTPFKTKIMKKLGEPVRQYLASKEKNQELKKLDKPEKEGILGAVAGGVVGSAAGIPGTVAGAYLGHKIQQAAKNRKNQQAKDNQVKQKT